jgi:hypothetical protein
MDRNPAFRNRVAGLKAKIGEFYRDFTNYVSRSNPSSNSNLSLTTDVLLTLGSSRGDLARSFKSLKYAIEVNLKRQRYTSHMDLMKNYFSGSPSGNVVSDLIALQDITPFAIGGPHIIIDGVPTNAVSLSKIRNLDPLMEAMSNKGRAWAAEVAGESSLTADRRRFVELVDAFWSTTLEQSRLFAQTGSKEFAELERFLRRIVVSPAKPVFTVAVFGVVNAGYILPFSRYVIC